ncbi:MAG: hypothetical protein ABR587_02275 [Candidatus Binatia bacterium]
MKQNNITSIVTFVFAAGLLAGVTTAGAETVTTSKTTTYTGVVSEVNPSSSTIILKSEASPSPVTYTYTKETTFVDSKGNVVTYETIKNSPVTVEYTTEGGQTVVRKVIQTAPAVEVAPSAPVIREKTTTRTETETR